MALKSGVVTASRLNVRRDPSTEQPPLTALPRGTRVTILDRSGGWYRIRKGQTEGFVHGDYLLLDQASAMPSFLHEDLTLQSISLQPESKLAPQAGTWSEKSVIRVWNRLGGLLAALSRIVEIAEGASVAVFAVESGGRSFSKDGRMVIRFENHIFWREWGRFHPDEFKARFRFDARQKWKRHEFKNAQGTWIPCHRDQAQEWEVFACARNLHEAAAMRSISMGGPQIMGFNHHRIGYDSVREMFSNFQADVRYQVLGFFDFLKGPTANSPMIRALQRGKFREFAALYNGSGQVARYGELIENRLEIFESLR